MPTNAKKPIIAWALYDWANSAFATTVIAAFFPVFFKSYWSAGSDVTESTFQLGLANSLSSLIVVLLAPFLGAIADQGGTRRKFLFAFAFLGVLATGCLYLVTQGAWEIAVVVYVLAAIGFSGGNTFYDALLVEVAGRDKSDSVSAFGYSLGYLGGGLLFALNVVMVLHPTTFGLADASEAVRVCFLLVAIWWAGFSLPLFLWVEESPPVRAHRGWSAISAGYRQLISTGRDIRQLRTTFVFLIGYWLYIDGVDTIIRMAIDYGLSLGLATNDLLIALGITQFVGLPRGACLRLDRRADRHPQGDLHRPSRLYRGNGVGLLSECRLGILRFGHRRRPSPRRGASPEPLALLAAHSPRPRGGVFWLLQHARQIRRGHRSGTRRLDWGTDRQPTRGDFVNRHPLRRGRSLPLLRR